MKDTAWYTKLWQNKMLELPPEGDADASWQKMQGLLDNNMPVNPPSKLPKPPKSTGSQLLSVAAIITTAALLYYAGTRMFKAHQHKNNKDTVQQIKAVSDSALNKDLSGTENYNAKDSTSASSQNNDTTIKNSALNSTENKADNTAGKNNIVSKEKNDSLYNTVNSSENKTGKISEKGKSNYKTHQKNAGTVASGKIKSGNASGSGQAALSAKNLVKGYHKQPVNKPNIKQGNNYKNTIGKLSDTVAASASRRSNILAEANQPNSSTISTTNGVNTKADTSLNKKKTQADKLKIATSNAQKSKPAKAIKPKNSKPVKQNKNSNFELAVKIGANSNGSFTSSNQNNNFYGKSAIDAFVGISGAYSINKKLAVGVGISMLSSKTISGSYYNSNYQYFTLNDTGKKITHNTGKINIQGTRKIYTVDVPIIASYRINKSVSINAGPVISIPVKQGTIRTTLSPLSSASSDTTVSPAVAPYVKSTTINNKVSVSFSVGARLNVNRFFIDASYLRGITPYTISSGLGSSKIYYQSAQFGVGYLLFKAKVK